MSITILNLHSAVCIWRWGKVIYMVPRKDEPRGKTVNNYYNIKKKQIVNGDVNGAILLQTNQVIQTTLRP